MKKLGYLIFAVVAVALLNTSGFAQRGGGNGGFGDGQDSVIRHQLDSLAHRLDSLEHLRRDSIPPNPHDSLGKRDTTDHGGHDTTDHRGHDSLPPPPHHGWGDPDSNNHGGFGSGLHTRIDIGRLLRSDSCLMDLEAQMTPADAAALQAALAALKNDGTQIQALEQALQTQLKTLRHTKPVDTAAVHAALNKFRTMSQPLLQDEQNQTKALNALLSKYTKQIQTVWTECTNQVVHPHRKGTGQNGDSTLQLMVSPVFPNPVSLANASGRTTLQYVLSMAAAVNITLSDASGNVIQTIANDQEIAGPHTATISIAGLKTGMYYLRVQAGTIVQTQKIVVIN